MFIVGYKLDLVTADPSKRQISFEEGNTYAKTFGYAFIEVSAKDNTNIDKLFDIIHEGFILKMENENTLNRVQLPQTTNVHQGFPTSAEDLKDVVRNYRRFCCGTTEFLIALIDQWPIFSILL